MSRRAACRVRESGFTLIELMVSVAIVGMLASVALPSFRVLQLRSRQAERRTMVRSIETAMADLWVREGKYPGGTPAASTFDGPWNPPLPAGTTKRRWNSSPTNGDWSRLTLVVEGDLYYSYRVDARAAGSSVDQYVYADGDLDGDGQENIYWRRTYDHVVATTPVREVEEFDNGLYAVDLF
jgi:prepilin-type N-terminal cleavage/methylation domain-containing protein